MTGQGMIKFAELASEFFTGETHPLYAARDRIVDEGGPLVDLVRANVTEHGLGFPEDVLREILNESVEMTAIYRPDPFEQPAARQAIESYYGATFSAQNILLTPGTSISYWYCFKLLAGDGDEVLCPTPSYPLLDYIARLSGVTLTNYKLDESQDWAIDFDDLVQQITSKTRAIVLISPHNPTGMVCSSDEITALAEIAAKHHLPIVSDEVFGDFLFGLDRLPRPAESAAPLVFTLNGLSKSFALPGLKLGWIAISGEDSLVKRSREVLETISDTFLPVSELAQASAAKIFERGRDFQYQYVKAIAALRATAVAALEGAPFVIPRGGFYITLPTRDDEDDIALSLLNNDRILVHPGHFYEMDGNHLVTTFIEDPEILKNCMRKLRRFAI